MPFFAVQWHPEKNVFELGKTTDGRPYEAIVHSPEAIAVTQYLANVSYLCCVSRHDRTVFSLGIDSLSLSLFGSLLLARCCCYDYLYFIQIIPSSLTFKYYALFLFSPYARGHSFLSLLLEKMNISLVILPTRRQQ